jgi:glycerate kinase
LRIILAPDSFKGTLTAKEACDAIEAGIRRTGFSGEVAKVPVADGGEGTVQSLVDAMGGTLVTDTVTGPLGRPVPASWGLLPGGSAAIEMAAASGLPLVGRPGPETALSATTRGTGELVAAALSKGCRHFIVGIGGSATTDGGIGMAEALGVRILFRGKDPRVRGGRVLLEIDRFDFGGLDPRARSSRFLVACDVDNPLYGERGAAYVYGPQKGADAATVKILDAGLRNFAEAIVRSGRKDPSSIPGAGAAGGLGAGLVAFLGGELRRGAPIVMEKVRLAEVVAGADLVITGEGRMDAQTLFGKTPMAVADIAKSHGVPVIALAGSLGDGHEKLLNAGFTGLFPMAATPEEIAKAMREPARVLSALAERVFSMWMRRTTASPGGS